MLALSENRKPEELRGLLGPDGEPSGEPEDDKDAAALSGAEDDEDM